MAQLIPQNIFKTSNRLFKVNGIGWDGEADCLWIHEVREVKHGETVFYEQIDGVFSKPKSVLQNLINENKLVIIK